jgi:hypothetical protein
MLGSVVKYVGLSEGERYHEFVGAVGYVTSYTRRAIDQSEHIAIRWFKPISYDRGQRRVTLSHFSLDRFEVLSAPPHSRPSP